MKIQGLRAYVSAGSQTRQIALRLYLRHALPNALGPVIVAGSLDVAAAIIAECGA